MKARMNAMQAGWMMSLLLLVTSAACAQQRPLTGQMMGGDPSTPVQPAPQASAAGPLRQVSDHQPPVTPTVVGADDPVATTGDETGLAGQPANEIGDVTRSLLQMQVDARRPGQSLPMLGDEATLAYRRYRRSFNHDIPEFYEATIGKHGDEGK